MRISWHRGGQELATSASLEAFVAAARHGAELIEVDVRRTADGVLVCVHDETVPELGAVTTLDYGALANSEQDRVLTLHQFCAALDDVDPACRSGIHLDLKDEGYELAAVDELIRWGRPLFVTTSIESSIRLVRIERPDVDAYLTIGSSRFGLSPLEVARLRLSELFPMRRVTRCRATGIAIHYALATPLIRWWCRQRGLAVVVWTVDRPAFVERWLLRDIDVLTTNRPTFALKRRAAFAEESDATHQ